MVMYANPIKIQHENGVQVGTKIQMYFSNDPAYFVSKHILKCQVIYLTSLKFINLFTNEKVCQVCLSGFLGIKRTFRYTYKDVSWEESKVVFCLLL